MFSVCVLWNIPRPLGADSVKFQSVPQRHAGIGRDALSPLPAPPQMALGVPGLKLLCGSLSTDRSTLSSGKPSLGYTMWSSCCCEFASLICHLYLVSLGVSSPF